MLASGWPGSCAITYEAEIGGAVTDQHSYFAAALELYAKCNVLVGAQSLASTTPVIPLYAWTPLKRQQTGVRGKSLYKRCMCRLHYTHRELYLFQCSRSDTPETAAAALVLLILCIEPSAAACIAQDTLKKHKMLCTARLSGDAIPCGAGGLGCRRHHSRQQGNSSSLSGSNQEELWSVSAAGLCIWQQRR